MKRVISRARVWLAIPLIAGGLFAFQSQAVANMGHHSKVNKHSHVEDHSKKCNQTEEQHESPRAQQHEHEHGCA
jgi:hypothetical protein